MTRKLVLIFVLFALLPTTLLSYFAIDYLAGEARRQALESLDYQVEIFSHEIFNRLQSGEHDMRGVDLERLADDEWFLLSQAQAESYGLSDQPRHRLLNGGSLLLSDENLTPGQFPVFMLMGRELETSEPRVLIRRLHEALVFGEPDTWDHSVDYCIFDDRRRLLYATKRRVCTATLESYGNRVIGHKGNQEFQVDTSDYISSHRSLFLKQHYGVESWWLALAKPRDEVFSAYQLFKTRFVALAVLVVLILTLTCLFLIRRQMAPLPKIMSGIRRVSVRDYSQPVIVDSGDELEELAHAFNYMAGRVSKQLRTQASLSGIDQLILSRVKKEDIIDIVLNKTGEVVPHNGISVLLMEADDLARAYYYPRHGHSGRMDELVTLGGSQHAIQNADGASLWARGDRRCPPPWWLVEALPDDCDCLQVLPVEVNGELVAMLCLGYEEQPPVDDENDKHLTAYANRIAVALANAEWENKLYQQAHYDGLTGLPNRPAMLDFLQHAIANSTREGESFAVLFVDLDDFKLVNDSMGHSVGDRLIKTLGDRFRSMLRSSDTVFRLGGDEFVVISRSCPDVHMAADVARRIAERLHLAINRSIKINGHDLRSSGSIGISLYPRDGESAESLLKNSDAAMYHSKSLCKGHYQFYAEELNAESIALVQLSSDINRALENDEFELYFQPKVAVGDHSVTGGEALIRWHHPRDGLKAPGTFVSKAEKLGLIARIDDWTLVETCKHLAKWRHYKGFGRVSVNISAMQIRDGNLNIQLPQLLHEHNIPGHMLELEITEGVLLEDIDKVTDTLTAVRNLGVTVSIDDYGTGYSSLSYMKNLPVDVLKIDREFIKNLHHSKADQAIVHSTITLAHELGMRVIAEGVELQEQLTILSNSGCDEIQGYYFSRPVPAADFQDIVLAKREQPESTRIEIGGADVIVL